VPVHRRRPLVHRPSLTLAERNPCESFNGRFRDEFLTTEQFGSMLEVQVLAEDWRIEYNTYRPHGSLGFLTPEAYRQTWCTTKQSTTPPTLS